MAHINSLGKIFGATLLAWGVAKLATRTRPDEKEKEQSQPIQQPQAYTIALFVPRSLDAPVQTILTRHTKSNDWARFNRSIDSWVDPMMSYEERAAIWSALG